MTATRCPYCHDDWHASLLEAWSDHEFMLDACCEGSQAEAVAELLEAARSPEHRRGRRRASPPDWIAEDLAAIGAVGFATGPCGVWLDYPTHVEPCSLSRAQAFVLTRHRHCRPPVGHRFSGALFNGITLVGVVMVGRPVARMIDHSTTCEINRLCIDTGLPEPLRHNGASQLLAWACREAAHRGFSRVITYTLPEESGASLRASGFAANGLTRGGRWGRGGRLRETHNAQPKRRWVRDLGSNRKSPESPATTA